MENTVNIKLPSILGKLNESRKIDYTVRMCRTKCNLILLKKGEAYGASGTYEYRMGGNNGQVDEDVAAAVVSELSRIVNKTATSDNSNPSDAIYEKVHDATDGEEDDIFPQGVSNVSFMFEEGDWYVKFCFTGHLLESEYVINVSKP